jgi:hypothetical protein
MTIAEISRYCEGAVWRMKSRAQFDYSLADLIGVSVARIMDSNVEYPTIVQVYPHLFEDETKEEEQQLDSTTNSINNFLAFAMAHNAKLKGVETENNGN